ncbi:MAG: endonuclease [Succinivibrionaceae bacterium]|nr:endonuclease [Succinivibrionaceae bacterium]
MKKSASCALLALSLLALPAPALCYDFSEAKPILGAIYASSSATSDGARQSLYCRCPMEFRKQRPVSADLKACGYQIREDQERANRIEWEHIVPAYRLGGKMECWKNGGREMCRRNLNFAEMEGDMHNIFPVIGEVNKDRRHYDFEIWMDDARSPVQTPQADDDQSSTVLKVIRAIVNFLIEILNAMGYQEEAESLERYGSKTIDYIADMMNVAHERTEAPSAQPDRDMTQASGNSGTQASSAPVAAGDGLLRYGRCQVTIDERNKRIQPPKEARGVIARSYLYMAQRYQFRLEPEERQRFEQWNLIYRPDVWECRRNLMIAREQGNDNPFITSQCSGK